MINNSQAVNDTQAFYDTKSLNNIDVNREGTALKAYVKTKISALTAKRLDNDGTDARISLIDIMLHSRVPIDYMPYVEVAVKRGDDVSYRLEKNSAPIPFIYADNVIELYSQRDIDVFERINAPLIADGRLVEYTNDAHLEYKDGELSHTPLANDNDSFNVAKVSKRS